MLVLPFAFRAIWQRSSETEEKGFSLLEVIIALAILAIGLVTLLELFAGSLRLTGKATQRTLAVIHAQNVMDSFFAQDFLEDGEDSGELENKGRTYVRPLFFSGHCRFVFPFPGSLIRPIRG